MVPRPSGGSKSGIALKLTTSGTASPVGNWASGEVRDCLSALDNVISACEVVESTSGPEATSALQQLRASIATSLASRRGSGGHIWKFGAHQLSQQECATLLPLLDAAIEALGLPEFLGDGMTEAETSNPKFARVTPACRIPIKRSLSTAPGLPQEFQRV